jgi:hypothetical protein
VNKDWDKLLWMINWRKVKRKVKKTVIDDCIEMVGRRMEEGLE